MKRVILFIVIVITSVCITTGCDSKEETVKVINNNQGVDFQIKNTSGVDWVLLTTDHYGSDEYRGGQESYDDEPLDLIDVSDFAIKAGESYPFKVSDASKVRAIEDGMLKEISETTYEYKLQCIAAGVVPTDPEEWCIEEPFANVQDMTISGIYGETVVIEWDGSTFKQAK